MDYKTMIQECIALLGDDYTASEEELALLKERLGRCINYAYERIARNYYHPVTTETVVTDDRCRIKKQLLKENFWYLRSVRCGENKVCTSVENAEIFIGNRPNSQVEITYCYIPSFMKDDTDVPCIPQGEISPQVYIFKALSIFMTTEGRNDDAVIYAAQADAALAGCGYPMAVMPQRRWI